VPAIDSVLFGSPRESVIDIIQIAGRALRPHGDADTATIIVPALLPDSPDDDDGCGDGGRYQHMLRVVRALCAHDETLSGRLGNARAGQDLGRPGGQQLPDGKITLLEQAGIAVRRPDLWLAGYQALADFKAGNGHLRVPDGYKTAGRINLSDWQRDQRVRRKAGRITAEQVRLLDEAGFCWDPLAEA
jgi:superfamily II DNA or RNA helicase